MKFGISILAVALLLSGCAQRGMPAEDADYFSKFFGLTIYSEPSGALIYGEDGTAWGVTKANVPGGPGLQKAFTFSSHEAQKQGTTTFITAVWASGAKSKVKLAIGGAGRPLVGSWTFSRPMDAPGLDIDLKAASLSQVQTQTPPQTQSENSAAAAALTAFGIGLAQARAAEAANRPAMCTSTQANGIVNTLCQ